VSAETTSATSMTLPSDREILIERVFDAPRRLVFDALTRPEHVARWYGPRALTLASCEIDLRVGGAWRYIVRDPAGNEFGFSGEYRGHQQLGTAAADFYATPLNLEKGR